MSHVSEAYRQEFAELEARAERYLENPRVFLPHRRPLLRLWFYPTFEPCVSWHVYSPHLRYAETDLPIAVRVTWDRPFDITRFRDPMKGLEYGLSTEPTLALNQVELSRAELASRLSILESIKIPVVIDRSIIIDGATFGFESFGEPSIRLTWWSTTPDTWKPIADWAADMTSFLDAQFSFTSNNNT